MYILRRARFAFRKIQIFEFAYSALSLFIPCLGSKSLLRVVYTLFFFIRTSNFDAEAERSYIFWRFEAETFLKMFLNLPGIVFQPIGLITVYDAILTGRQSGQKLQRLYGNPIANNFFQK